jgi:hypothetical protein
MILFHRRSAQRFNPWIAKYKGNLAEERVEQVHGDGESAKIHSSARVIDPVKRACPNHIVIVRVSMAAGKVQLETLTTPKVEVCAVKVKVVKVKVPEVNVTVVPEVKLIVFEVKIKVFEVKAKVRVWKVNLIACEVKVRVKLC